MTKTFMKAALVAMALCFTAPAALAAHYIPGFVYPMVWFIQNNTDRIVQVRLYSECATHTEAPTATTGGTSCHRKGWAWPSADTVWNLAPGERLGCCGHDMLFGDTKPWQGIMVFVASDEQICWSASYRNPLPTDAPIHNGVTGATGRDDTGLSHDCYYYYSLTPPVNIIANGQTYATLTPVGLRLNLEP